MADGYGHLPRGPKRLMMAARWSAQGLRAAWLHESSFRLEVVLALVLAPLGLLLGETGVERALLATTAQRLAWLRHLPQDRRWGRDLQRARAAYDLLNPSSHAAATP